MKKIFITNSPFSIGFTETHQRLREYRFYVNVDRGVNIDFYIMLLITSFNCFYIVLLITFSSQNLLSMMNFFC